MATADSSPWDGVLDALTSLASLRNDGLLTAEELAAAQARLLGGGDLQAAGSVPGARREMTAAVLAALVLALFAVDSLARVLTLRRAQILWWALGSLPCLAFAAALLTPRERARSALPPPAASWRWRLTPLSFVPA